MGGQACVFYGAAQFSRDVDLETFVNQPANHTCNRVVSSYHRFHENSLSQPFRHSSKMGRSSWFDPGSQQF
jgi:hypothetical protein